MTARSVFGFLRLAIAVACFVSLIGRYIWGNGTATFSAANFFGYLTIQSNVFFLFVTVLAAVFCFAQPDDPVWFTTLRATVLTGTVTSGVVYAILVQQSAARGFAIDVPWSDQIMHFWLPSIALADWILVPGRHRALWRTIPFVVGYVVIWGIATFVRGAVVGWYPYYFLDPHQVSGPLELVISCSAALACFVAVAAGMVALTKRRPVLERRQLAKG